MKKQLFTPLYNADTMQAVIAQNEQAKRNTALLDIDAYFAVKGIDASKPIAAGMRAFARERLTFQATEQDWAALFAKF